MYDHLNYKHLSLLYSKNLVNVIPYIRIPSSVCDKCMTSKQPRTTFGDYSANRATNLLHVVYSDVCGPIEVSSLGGNRYFVSFFYEYSRNIWTYLLKVKSAVFGTF